MVHDIAGELGLSTQRSQTGARLEFWIWIPSWNQTLQRLLALLDPKTKGSIS